jgi:hypothetical protein
MEYQSKVIKIHQIKDPKTGDTFSFEPELIIYAQLVDGVWSAQLEFLGIWVLVDEEKDITKEIEADFLVGWKLFALEEDENLASDGQKLKKNLLRRTKVNGKYLPLPN